MPEQALLVTLRFRDSAYRDSWPADEVQAELRELAVSSGLEVAGELLMERPRPSPAHLIGPGQAEKVQEAGRAAGAQVVVFGENLSSTQQRNLEEVVTVKIVDRTQLILDIFARRARSSEGKVQVELAQLQYMLPRLAGKGIMLSRLGGGIGTRGPGEQKLEMDRRRIRARIRRLAGELAQIQKRRSTARRKRSSEETRTAALIGYTNAGKSTLLNALTQAGAKSEDSLFTTLDPLTRRLDLSNGQQVLLTDTVGFLHRLPHHLIQAFRATLQEAAESRLLLHVMDASSPLMEEKETAVHEVLDQLRTDRVPMLKIFNKIDRLPLEEKEHLRRTYPDGVFLSAKTGEGLDHLRDRLLALLGRVQREVTLLIPRGEESWVSRIYKEGEVLQRKDLVSGTKLKARIPVVLEGKLAAAGLIPSAP